MNTKLPLKDLNFRFETPLVKSLTIVLEVLCCKAFGLLNILNEELNYLCAIPTPPCYYIGDDIKRLVCVRLGFTGGVCDVGLVGVVPGDLLLVYIAKSRK